MSDTIFEPFIRIPFPVQAVNVTEENLEEVAKIIGKVETDGDKRFITVNQKIVPRVVRVYVGWYVTLLGSRYRCYSPRVFEDQFMPAADVATFGFPSLAEVEAYEEVAEVTYEELADVPPAVPDVVQDAPAGWPSA